jgi:succinoglycan biosynthesis protein ExoA
MSEPLVSVVIAARNAASTIDACLAALATQTFQSHEVIVVDDGSTDDTAQRAAAAGAQVLDAAGRGASAARNLGIRHARGRYVAFTDADCVPPPHWLARLVEALETTGATGVGSGQRNVFPTGGRDAAAFDAFFRLASVVSDYTRGAGTSVRPVAHNASCNSAYRRDALLAAGGFSEGLWPGEDVDLDIRLRAAGGTLLSVPGADVEHHRPGHLAWFRQMMRRYGAAEREIVRRHGRRRRIDFLPPVLGAAIAVHALYLVPACRPWLLAADAAILLGAFLALAATTPPRHWSDVVVFSSVAVWEWLSGWRRG